MNFTKPSPRTRELHLAKRDMGPLYESKRIAEPEKARAESELFNAKKTVRYLNLRIEESNSRAKAKAQLHSQKTLKKPMKNTEKWELALRNTEDFWYAEQLRELQYVKQELRKLKLEMAFVLDEKIRAEKETESSSSKLQSYSSSVEPITKEIEELNEEKVLVQLAQIEALKELGVIETQRKATAKKYSSAMEETRKKINGIILEIDRTKELEMKLAVTNSDVKMLHNELRQVKDMDRRAQKIESTMHQTDLYQEGKEWGSPSLLQSVTEELEAVKEMLASIRELGFQFMASMDIIRDELNHVLEERARLKKTEEEADLTVQKLSSKLLRANIKLEAASAAKEKAKSIVSNLCLVLEQLKTAAEAAKKEKTLLSEETAEVEAEVQKTEFKIDLAEERLQVAMQEVEAAKSSEAKVLDNLKSLAENTMGARASVSQLRSKITISTFEYEYLAGHADWAEDIADKKVASAQACIEAIKASEKEILMKTEIAQREIIELRVEEEKALYTAEQSLSEKREVEKKLRHWSKKHEKRSKPSKLQRQITLTRKSTYRSENASTARPVKYRKSASPAARHMTQSTSFTMRRRRRVMPSLAKFITSKSIERFGILVC